MKKIETEKYYDAYRGKMLMKKFEVGKYYYDSTEMVDIKVVKRTPHSVWFVVEKVDKWHYVGGMYEGLCAKTKVLTDEDGREYFEYYGFNWLEAVFPAHNIIEED